VQLVALNYQHFDHFLLLNEGFFRHQNGGAGYVLKPPASLGQKTEAESLKIQLHIISAHGVWRPMPQAQKTSLSIAKQSTFAAVLSSDAKVSASVPMSATPSSLKAPAVSKCYIKVKMYDALKDAVEHSTKTAASLGPLFTWKEDLEFEVKHVDTDTHSGSLCK
jgi:hypothetical protein